MFFNRPQPVANHLVDKLMNQRDREMAELQAIREELETLQAVLRSKQERLRKMNRQIIKRQQSLQYLQVVSSQPRWRVTKNNGPLPALQCMQGGKH